MEVIFKATPLTKHEPEANPIRVLAIEKQVKKDVEKYQQEEGIDVVQNELKRRKNKYKKVQKELEQVKDEFILTSSRITATEMEKEVLKNKLNHLEDQLEKIRRSLSVESVVKDLSLKKAEQEELQSELKKKIIKPIEGRLFYSPNLYLSFLNDYEKASSSNQREFVLSKYHQTLDYYFLENFKSLPYSNQIDYIQVYKFEKEISKERVIDPIKLLEQYIENLDPEEIAEAKKQEITEEQAERRKKFSAKELVRLKESYLSGKESLEKQQEKVKAECLERSKKIHEDFKERRNRAINLQNTINEIQNESKRTIEDSQRIEHLQEELNEITKSLSIEAIIEAFTTEKRKQSKGLKHPLLYTGSRRERRRKQKLKPSQSIPPSYSQNCVNFFINKWWISNFKAFLISPIYPSISNYIKEQYINKDIITGEINSLAYYYPNSRFWKDHCTSYFKYGHGYTLSIVNNKVQLNLQSSENKIYSFYPLILFQDLSYREFNFKDLEIENIRWQEWQASLVIRAQRLLSLNFGIIENNDSAVRHYIISYIGRILNQAEKDLDVPILSEFINGEGVINIKTLLTHIKKYDISIPPKNYLEYIFSQVITKEFKVKEEEVEYEKLELEELLEESEEEVEEREKEAEKTKKQIEEDIKKGIRKEEKETEKHLSSLKEEELKHKKSGKAIEEEIKYKEIIRNISTLLLKEKERRNNLIRKIELEFYQHSQNKTVYYYLYRTLRILLCADTKSKIGSHLSCFPNRFINGYYKIEDLPTLERDETLPELLISYHSFLKVKELRKIEYFLKKYLNDEIQMSAISIVKLIDPSLRHTTFFENPFLPLDDKYFTNLSLLCNKEDRDEDIIVRYIIPEQVSEDIKSDIQERADITIPQGELICVSFKDFLYNFDVEFNPVVDNIFERYFYSHLNFNSILEYEESGIYPSQPYSQTYFLLEKSLKIKAHIPSQEGVLSKKEQRRKIKQELIQSKLKEAQLKTKKYEKLLEEWLAKEKEGSELSKQFSKVKISSEKRLKEILFEEDVERKIVDIEHKLRKMKVSQSVLSDILERMSKKPKLMSSEEASLEEQQKEAQLKHEEEQKLYLKNLEERATQIISAEEANQPKEQKSEIDINKLQSKDVKKAYTKDELIELARLWLGISLKTGQGTPKDTLRRMLESKYKEIGKAIVLKPSSKEVKLERSKRKIKLIEELKIKDQKIKIYLIFFTTFLSFITNEEQNEFLNKFKFPDIDFAKEFYKMNPGQRIRFADYYLIYYRDRLPMETVREFYEFKSPQGVKRKREKALSGNTDDNKYTQPNTYDNSPIEGDIIICDFCNKKSPVSGYSTLDLKDYKIVNFCCGECLNKYLESQ